MGNLRIGLLGLVNSKKGVAESDFLRLAAMVRFSNAKKRKDFFYFMSSYSTDEKRREIAAYVRQLGENILPLFYKEPGSFYEYEAWVPQELLTLFNAKMGQYPIDAFITSRTASLVSAKRLVKDIRREEESSIVWVIVEPEAWYDEMAGDKAWINRATRALGYASADWVFFQSQYEMDLGLDLVRECLQPSLVAEVMAKSSIETARMDADDVDRAVAGVQKNPVKTVFYGGRFNKVKGGPEIFENMKKLFELGEDCRFEINVGGVPSAMKGVLSELKKASYIDIKTGVRRERFLQNAAAAHVVFYPAKHEAFGSGLCEMIYCGVIPVLRDTEWVREFLPDYKYKFTSLTEGLSMMRHVLRNYEQVSKDEAWLRPYLREKMSSANPFQDVFDKVEELVNSRLIVVPSFGKVSQRIDPETQKLETQGMLIDRVKKRYGKRIPLEKFYAEVNSLTENFRGKETVPRIGQFSRYDMWKYLRACGYADNGEEEYPVLELVQGDGSLVVPRSRTYGGDLREAADGE